MLILTRKPSEEVILFDRDTGEELGRVVLCAMRPGDARIGFDLLPNIGIARKEVYGILKPPAVAEAALA